MISTTKFFPEALTTIPEGRSPIYLPFPETAAQGPPQTRWSANNSGHRDKARAKASNGSRKPRELPSSRPDAIGSRSNVGGAISLPTSSGVSSPAMSMIPPPQYPKTMPASLKPHQMPHQMLFGNMAPPAGFAVPANLQQPIPVGSFLPAPLVTQSAPGAWNGGDQEVSAMEPSLMWGYGMRQYGSQPFRPEVGGMTNKLNPYGRGFPYGFYKTVL